MLRPPTAAAAAILLVAACASPVMSQETDNTTTTGAPVTTGTGEVTTATSGDGTASASAPTSAPTSAGTSEPGTGTTGEPGDLFLSDKFLNIAHRGGGLARPEETLIAFEHALAVGADVIEFDLHASADGVIVAIHDEKVDRTTDGVGMVKALSLAELQALDAGYRFTADDGATYPYRGVGITIPTLDEILDNFPDSYYLIEIKQAQPSIVDAVVASLADHGATERVVIASFSLDTIAAVRLAAPGVLTALSLPEMVDLNARIGDPEYVPPAGFVQSPWDLTSAELVSFAHGLGLKVHPWTVNSASAMTDLVARGVDGIMTDDPALLAEVAP